MFEQKEIVKSIDECDFSGIKIVYKMEQKKKVEVINVPAAFDIESTNFYNENDEKCAIMYHWQFGIAGYVIFGRTWEEFKNLCTEVSRKLGLSPEKRLIVFVHNLEFEFQFMRKHFEWSSVFAVDERKAVKALTTLGIEFRCSAILTGRRLANVPEMLTKYPIEKMVGDLDYSLLRHSKTPLTEKELKYCENDVRVVMALIQEKIEEEGGDITKIPLTKTGYVRRHLRELCLHSGNKKDDARYREFIHTLNLDTEEYKTLRFAFQGGFTHAGYLHVGEVCENVKSRDFTSSYPAQMIGSYFPMSSAHIEDVSTLTRAKFENLLEMKCCLMVVTFHNLRQRPDVYESPLSFSHLMKGYVNAERNNGRIFSCEKCTTVITELDYKVYRRAYYWDRMEIHKMYTYDRGYLPKSFIEGLLELYEAKTSLKNVEGKEAEYNLKKEAFNSSFGMTVTDVLQEENLYICGEWKKEGAPDVDEVIRKYNKSWDRFLFYPWGIWITAHARYALFTAIFELGEDYIYSDTDSVKYLNWKNHEEYFSRYNAHITKKLEVAMKYHGLDPERTAPKTVKGVKKPLGVWDDDGFYSRFKTLGAKRYLTEDAETGKIKLTMAGVNKNECVKWWKETRHLNNDEIFADFSDDLFIPEEATGKLTHSYIDETRSGVLYDYQGTPAAYEELSAVHLEGATYSLGISEEFKNFLRGRKEVKK